MALLTWMIIKMKLTQHGALFFMLSMEARGKVILSIDMGIKTVGTLCTFHVIK